MPDEGQDMRKYRRSAGELLDVFLERGPLLLREVKHRLRESCRQHNVVELTPHQGFTLMLIGRMKGTSMKPLAQAANESCPSMFAMVEGCPALGEILPDLLKFLGKRRPILFAHNAYFDIRFLAFELVRHGIAFPDYLFLTCPP